MTDVDMPVTINYKNDKIIGRVKLSLPDGAMGLLASGFYCLAPSVIRHEDGSGRIAELSIILMSQANIDNQ